jgi:hypothetical protein
MNTSKNELQAVLTRIKNKGIRASDIKFNDRLTPEDIFTIPRQTVFNWVKTGEWSQRDFNKWYHISVNLGNKGE